MTDRFLRATKDVDLEANVDADVDAMRAFFVEAISHEVPDDGIIFDVAGVTAEIIKAADEYHGIRLFVQAILGRQQEGVQIDFGFGDRILLPPDLFDYPVLLETLPRPRWGLKVYFSGTIAYHWPISSFGQEILDRFETALEATISFSGRFSDELGIVANRYAIGSVLSNAAIGASGTHLTDDPGALVVLPGRWPFLSPTDFATKAKPTAREITRILQTRYPAT